MQLIALHSICMLRLSNLIRNISCESSAAVGYASVLFHVDACYRQIYNNDDALVYRLLLLMVLSSIRTMCDNLA